ncbi:MAG: hypothetical protein ABI689_07870 [Thermoanaerobaculia bacterium]
MPRKPRRAAEQPPLSPTAAVTRSGWSDGRWALVLGLLAALLRVLFLFSGTDRSWPYTVFYEGDSETFFRFARALLAGELYDGGIPFHPPGFAFFLAGLQTLVGAGAATATVPHLAIKLILAVVVGGGSVALLYLATAAALGRTVAIVTALLAAFHFGLYVLAVAPVGDGLFQLLLLAAITLLVRRPEGELSRARIALLGLVWGAMALTRAEGILLGGLIAGFGAFLSWKNAAGANDAPRWRNLLPWAAVALVAVAVVLPWTVRNAIRLGEAERRLAGGLAEPLPRFVPVTIYGPLVLALANHDGADGSFSRAALPSHPGDATFSLTDPEHLRFLLHGDRIAFAWTTSHPWEFVRLVGRKWTLYAGALQLGWTQWDLPGGLTGLRRPVDLFVPERRIGIWLWLPVLAAGIALGSRSGEPARRWLLLVGLLTAGSMMMVALSFGYARFGVLLLPLWMSIAAAAIVSFARWLVERLPEDQRGLFRGSRGRSLAATLVLLLVALEVAGTVRGHRFEATGTTLPGSTRLDRDQPIHFRPLPPG